MAYILPVGLGVVAGVFLIVVLGEVFYLVYWRKRPTANPRVNNITVAPITEVSSVGVRNVRGSEVAIDVTCAEYQISALHQDLVEKLFPVLGMSADSTQSLMGPPRMLFTITEETKEELEGLEWDGRARSRRNSRSKSMSDISLSPLSPISTPFATPLSSPDPFVTPYGTPTYSPLVGLHRSLSANQISLKTSCRIMYDYASAPPPAPPSPTRPSFPFLARPMSPGTTSQTDDAIENRLTPISNALLYSPPRKPFVFSTSPIHTKQVESGVKSPPSLTNCKYVYENGTYSPSSPSSPKPFPSAVLPTSAQVDDHSCHEIHEHSSPPFSPRSNSTDSRTPPSESVFASNADQASSSSSSFKPWSQRSSSVLFSSTGRPHGRSPLLIDHIPAKAFLVSGTSSPPRSSGWKEHTVSIPFIQPISTAQ